MHPYLRVIGLEKLLDRTHFGLFAKRDGRLLGLKSGDLVKELVLEVLDAGGQVYNASWEICRA